MSKVKICLIGVDGSGKTSHLLTMKRELSGLGLRCKYISVRGIYFRFISLPLLYLCRLFGYEGKTAVEGCERYTRHPNLVRNSAIKPLWTILFLIDVYILAMLRGYFWSRVEVVLCDRYMADSIVDLMANFKDDTTYRKRIGRFFLSITRPDMVLLLDVNEKEAFKRKRDALSLEQLGLRRKLYRKMASELGMPIIDASRPFAAVHRDILNHVKNIVRTRMVMTSFMVDLLFSGDEAHRFCAVEHLPRSKRGWHLLLTLFERNRVLCRALRRLLDVFKSELDNDQRKIIQEKLNECTERSGEALNLIALVQHVLRESGINFTIFKTLDDYPDVGEDIDIMILRKDLTKAEEALLKIGAKKDPSMGDFISLLSEIKWKRHLLYDLGDFSFQIELYPELTVFGEEYISGKDVIENSGLASFSGQPVYVPRPEDALLITCIHIMYKHGGVVKLHEVYNTVCLLENSGGSLDWKYLIDASRSKGMMMGLMCFLYIVEDFYRRYSNEVLPVPNNVRHRDSRVSGSLKMKGLPYRIPLTILLLIFAYKFLFDIRRSMWSSALKTLQTCLSKTGARALYFVFKSTRRYACLKRWGWYP